MNNKTRCKWSQSNELDTKYHDKEWGVPVYNDQKLFELLILEGAQAGVSWHVVLQKRDRYKKVFSDFDPEKCARLTDKKLESALTDTGLIRNRLKIYSVRSNAIALIDVISGTSLTESRYKTNLKLRNLYLPKQQSVLK